MDTEIDLLKEIILNSKKNIRLRPPLAAGQVLSYEEKCGVKLPKDYFDFLTKIGDGGSVPGLAPGCDRLISLAEYRREGYSLKGIKNPFTLEKSWMPDWGDEIENAPEDEEELEKLMSKRWDMIRHDGNLTLAEDKTDSYRRWFLVVTGPCRGEVWLESEFGVLRFPGCSFSKWLLMHLDGSWEGYAKEQARREQKERESREPPREKCLKFLIKNKYRPNPPASIEAVREFEARRGIALPEDYVKFVTEVADGSRPPRKYYAKLYSLQEAGGLGNLDKPFFFQTKEQFRRAVVRQYGSFPDHGAVIDLKWSTLEPFLSTAVPSKDSPWVPPMLERMNGCLPLRLSVLTRRRSTAFLILNGEFRGQIWSANLQGGVRAYYNHKLSTGERVNVMNYLETCRHGAFGS